MGFKENLKAELNYSGMLVKELSALSGVKKHTIDNYLNTHNSIPAADAAVSIARVLGVSVEYLITGHEAGQKRTLASLSPEVRSLIQIAENFDEKNLKILLAVAKAFKEQLDLQGKY
jgi:transcriptional regulator with XRE-family HTH domain